MTLSWQNARAQDKQWTQDDILSLAVLLLAVIGFLWRVTPGDPLYVTDSIYYVGGALSIGEGSGYRLPVQEGNPHIGFYPPLQSLFLSAAWLFDPAFPENQTTIKALMIALWTTTLLLLFAVLRIGGLSLSLSWLLTFSVGTSGVWGYFVIHCFSDVLFSALVFLATYLALRRTPNTLTRSLWIGLLLAFMYLTRTATIGFLPGAACVACVASYRHHSFKPFACLMLPVLVAASAWALAPDGTYSYGKFFSGDISHHGGIGPWIQHLILYCGRQSWGYLNGDHLFQNLSTDIGSMLLALAPGVPQWQRTTPVIFTILGLVFWGLCAIGAVKSPNHRALQVGVAFYLVQVLVWPFPLGFRGLLPLLPLFILWSKKGAQTLPRYASPLLRRAAIIAIAACIVSNLAGAFDHSHLRDNSTEKAETVALSEWIAASIPKEARLASDVSHPLLHIYAATRHPFVIVDGLSSATRLRCDYVLMSGGLSMKRASGVGNDHPQLEIAWESQHGRYQVLRLSYPD